MGRVPALLPRHEIDTSDEPPERLGSAPAVELRLTRKCDAKMNLTLRISGVFRPCALILPTVLLPTVLLPTVLLPTAATCRSGAGVRRRSA